MSSWLDKTLAKLLPSHTQHIIASDPDGILGYHEIIKAIEGRGITILRAASPLEARVRFELDVRGSDKKSVLIINTPYQPLPDILLDAYLVPIGYKDTDRLLVQDGLKDYLQKQWNTQAAGTESSINFTDPLLAKSAHRCTGRV